MKTQALWLALFALPLVATSATAVDKPGTRFHNCPEIAGGGGSTWSVCDDFATDNGLPTGGVCSAGANGGGASIREGTLTGSFSTDAFDQAANVWVNNAVVGGVRTVVGNGATFAPVTLSGLTVNMRYDFLTTEATQRTFVSFTNPTGSPITATIAYTTNFGSDETTVINATSSGDTVFTTADRWLITSDGFGFDDDPVNTTVVYSGTPPLVPNTATTTVYACFETNGALTTYALTVPAGSTSSLLFFQRMTETVAQATSTAAQFNDLQSGSPLLAGLTSSELAQVQNIGAATPPPPPNLGPGYTGVWYNPAQDGHGIFIEILPNNVMVAAWYVYAPEGGQAWIVGSGNISGNTGTVSGTLATGTRFPPNFNAAQVVRTPWGQLVFTFTDCNNGRLDYSSTLAGYGSGSIPLTRLTLPAGSACTPAGAGE